MFKKEKTFQDSSGREIIENKKEELHWEREDGSWIFGGKPVIATGIEPVVPLRFSLLKKLKHGKTILSIGCGLGAEMQPLTKDGFVTVGLDPERGFLKIGKTKESANSFICAVGEAIPLCGCSFDVVLLFDVLEHVKNPDTVLEEIGRILKTKGILFVAVPNRFYLFETHGIQIYRKNVDNFLGIGIPFFSFAPDFLRKRLERARIYTETEILSLLKKHDFEPLIIECMMPTLDVRKQTALTKALRNVFSSLGSVPIIKKCGPSIMVISQRI